MKLFFLLFITQSILPARACPSLCVLEPLGLILGLDKSKEEKKSQSKKLTVRYHCLWRPRLLVHTVRERLKWMQNVFWEKNANDKFIQKVTEEMPHLLHQLLPKCQFHQHFNSSFCAQESTNLKCKHKKATLKTFIRKSRVRNVNEIDHSLK